MKKYAIGIDLGGTKIMIALVDKLTGEVIGSVKKKTKKDKGPKNIIRKMIEGIEELIEETSIEKSKIKLTLFHNPKVINIHKFFTSSINFNFKTFFFRCF